MGGANSASATLPCNTAPAGPQRGGGEQPTRRFPASWPAVCHAGNQARVRTTFLCRTLAQSPDNTSMMTLQTAGFNLVSPCGGCKTSAERLRLNPLGECWAHDMSWVALCSDIAWLPLQIMLNHQCILLYGDVHQKCPPLNRLPCQLILWY